MFMQLIEYACPNCKARYGAAEERAGTSQVCCSCKTTFVIPAGLPCREVEVGDSPGIALTAEEEAAVRNMLSRRGTGPAVAGMVAERLLHALFEALLRRLGIGKRS